MKTLVVQVQADHLERLTSGKPPVYAVAELIWNALDADAERVDVFLNTDDLGELSEIKVVDNGHGMPYGEVDKFFSRLGGSWKKERRQTHKKQRLLHGSEGRGRFHAFSLGRVVDWNVTYAADGGLLKYRLSMIKDRLKEVQVSEEEPAQIGEPGVTVMVSELDGNFRSLQDDSIVQKFEQIFALYLFQYSEINIFIDHKHVDPNKAVDHKRDYALPDFEVNGESMSVSLEIVEWKMKTERQLFLCDSVGFPLDSISPGVQAPGFHFTAYLKSDYFAKLQDENRLLLSELDELALGTMETAKETIRDHFRQRVEEQAIGLVKEWQNEHIYPYQDQPKTEAEKVKRQVFDVVALNLNSYLPSFETADTKTKRLHLRLLRQAVEHAPDDLSRILSEVLELPQEKQQELAGLLDRTTLSHIISASKIITDRLEFLHGLETLVFDPEFRKRVRERRQLHRILADNAWIFGEQYHLSVDDRALTEVLKQHIGKRKHEITIDEPVTQIDGRRGLVDLMLSRLIQRAGTEEREHLIVELKRPSTPINSDSLTQIKNYAFAVAEDQRFRGVPAKWAFWVISSDMDHFASLEVKQRDRPPGMVYATEEPSITIWAKTWSQIISECKARLRFFSDKLSYAPDRDQSLAHLQNTYSKYFSDSVLEVPDEKKSSQLPPPD